MQYDFTFHNPTRIHFGKNSLIHLSGELTPYKTILFCYGGGSIKKSGLYDEIMRIIKMSGKQVVELPGITPNPKYSKVCEGENLVREKKVDFILAVGGGSVIDCAKAIAALSHVPGDDRYKWTNYFIGDAKLTYPVVPLGTVLTMVGTGSEMNGGMVITDEETMTKTAMAHPETFPKFSILNPELTYTLPTYQMVSGVFDAMSHLMENYFSNACGENLSDDIAETILKSLIRNTRAALKNPNDFTARSNIMWCATMALNGITACSKVGDWEVHQIEHQLGAYTDCAHGIGLAAISPAYYRRIYKYGLSQFVRFAKNVWSVRTYERSDEEIALAGIEALEEFTKECGMKYSLRELGVKDESALRDIAYSCNTFESGFKGLTHSEILEILKEVY